MLCDFIISAQMCNVMHSGALISFSINHLCTLWGAFMIISQTFQLSHEFDLIAICIFYGPATAIRLLMLSFKCTRVLYVDECMCTCLRENSVNHVMACSCMHQTIIYF